MKSLLQVVFPVKFIVSFVEGRRSLIFSLFTQRQGSRPEPSGEMFKFWTTSIAHALVVLPGPIFGVVPLLASIELAMLSLIWRTLHPTSIVTTRPGILALPLVLLIRP